MRVAFSLGGTDLGRSGLGVWVREVLPRLTAMLAGSGDSLVVLGEPGELLAYQSVLGSADRVRMPPSFGVAALSALTFLGTVGRVARRAGADVLLLPAANRRVTAFSPIPVVAVVHDFANFRVPGQSDPLRNAYRRLLVLRALRSATEIVTVSSATRRDLTSLLGPDAPDMHVVPNGVDTSRFAACAPEDPLVAEARTRVGLSDPYVLYPARLEHPQKNHLRLVAAFARSEACSGHQLALCGADWGAQQLVEREITQRRLDSRVRLLGFVSDEDLPLLVAGASAIAMVGLHEGFGLPALEALAAGRPVVASETGALPEVVGSLGVLCDPTSERSIADALDRALRDLQLRDRCVREGPTRAGTFCWDNTARGILAACHRARNRGRA